MPRKCAPARRQGRDPVLDGYRVSGRDLTDAVGSVLSFGKQKLADGEAMP